MFHKNSIYLLRYAYWQIENCMLVIILSAVLNLIESSSNTKQRPTNAMPSCSHVS